MPCAKRVSAYHGGADLEPFQRGPTPNTSAATRVCPLSIPDHNLPYR